MSARSTTNLAFQRPRQPGVDTVLERREARCVHCGACVGQCPARALGVDAATARVVFDGRRCLACGLCIPACGYGALGRRGGGR
jgi:Fe-S-cluster-containing dehydrogenase component